MYNSVLCDGATKVVERGLTVDCFNRLRAEKD